MASAQRLQATRGQLALQDRQRDIIGLGESWPDCNLLVWLFPPCGWDEETHRGGSGRPVAKFGETWRSWRKLAKLAKLGEIGEDWRS